MFISESNKLNELMSVVKTPARAISSGALWNKLIEELEFKESLSYDRLTVIDINLGAIDDTLISNITVESVFNYLSSYPYSASDLLQYVMRDLRGYLSSKEDIINFINQNYYREFIKQLIIQFNNLRTTLDFTKVLFAGWDNNTSAIFLEYSKIKESEEKKIENCII